MNNRLNIKYPYSIRTVIILAWVIVVMLFNLRIHRHPGIFNEIMNMFDIGLACFSALGIGWIGYRGMLKPKSLIMKEHHLMLGDEMIETEQIEKIILDGNVYGIKLKKRRLVPARMCFVLMKGQPAGELDLLIWAKQNDIAVTRRFFMKWV